MPRPFPWRLVTFDVDGTLTRGHGWAPIAAAFGRTAEFDATGRRFLAGDEGEDEHLERLLDLASGHSVAEVEAVLERTPRLAGISETVARLAELGAVPALLTHNPPYVTGWYERTFGFRATSGVDVQALRDGVIQRPGPVSADKRAGTEALCARFRVPATAAVHVGDGWADIPVFRAVGAGVSLNSALPEVRATADVVLETTDLRDVPRALERLTPRT